MLCIKQMTKIIKNGEVIESDFTIVKDENINIGIANQLLPLSIYLKNLENLMGRNDYGVWLDSNEEIEALSGIIHFNVIALNFPTFNDGRPYSNANLLRERLKFRGEIRAIGDVRRDQLEQMVRCGFNAFEMAENEDLAASLNSLQGFSLSYQATADRPEPLFRQR